ncbi:MAG: exo-beta-N-acetylmuramidase NamZ domain-containing protein, partial [Limisphaerales bacterium]
MSLLVSGLLVGVGFQVEVRAEIRTGADHLLADEALSMLRGKRVGLITNPTGVTHDLDSLPLRLRQRKDLELVALYGPEHGVRGNAQAGDKVGFQWDPVLGLPLFSLYGKTFKPTGPMLTNIA